MRYLGDSLKPSRVWTLVDEVDERTVRLTTKDLQDLPPAARIAADRRSAVLVCRRTNMADHSDFEKVTPPPNKSTREIFCP